MPPSPTAAGGVPLRAWLLLPFLAVAWGATWPLMKIGAAEIPILTFRAMTGFLAGGALLLLARLRYGTAAPMRRDWRGIALCGFVSVTAWFYLSALSVTLLPASRAALLAYTMPFWAFLIGVLFLKEPIALRRVFGVAAGVSAILLMAWDDVAAAVGSAGVVFPWGVAAITAAAIVWSVGSTLQKEMAFQSPVMQVAGWQLLIGAAPLAALALAFEPMAWTQTVGARALLATAGVALISQALGMASWFTLLNATSVAFASLAVLVVPAMGMALSVLLLGERLGLVDALGFLLIATGLATVLPFGRVFGRRRPPG
ncbi:MAG: DMT family transporter [Alphaproteobacteria bacterium]|nr:DMT family transporter [Alphaproteobacteria bacterium]